MLLSLFVAQVQRSRQTFDGGIIGQTQFNICTLQFTEHRGVINGDGRLRAERGEAGLLLGAVVVCRQGVEREDADRVEGTLFGNGERTGNLDIIPNAHAREVIMGRDGRATGLLFIDKKTGREERVKAKVVVLAASSGETVRILLNSKSAQFKNGLANSKKVAPSCWAGAMPVTRSQAASSRGSASR